MEILGVNNQSTVHFIGIGGISMSSLAVIMHENGYTVTGSDISESQAVKRLLDTGIKVFIGHDKENVGKADLVVYTAAINKENPEYLYCINNNIPIVERSVFLGALMKAYKYPLCISGTHGKTTTTSMVALIMEKAGLDPTCLVGGVVKELGSNLRIGKSEVFVTESCEYVESFLKFFPYRAVILNIDEDHLDYFKDINHIISSFNKFARLVPKEGAVLVNGEDENSLKAVGDLQCEVLTFGLDEKNDIVAKNVVFDKFGRGEYDFYFKGEKIERLSLSVPGRHNVLNSLASAGISYMYGADALSIKKALSEFKGTDRRFEYKGTYNGADIFDDYAHHPTEIKAALAAAKNYENKKINVVFQSHTYTRTYALLKEFSESFDLADKIIITDIYAAREKDTGLVHASELCDLIKKRGRDAIYISSFKDIEKHLRENLTKDDLLITIGAGDVYKIGEAVLKD